MIHCLEISILSYDNYVNLLCIHSVLVLIFNFQLLFSLRFIVKFHHYSLHYRTLFSKFYTCLDRWTIRNDTFRGRRKFLRTAREIEKKRNSPQHIFSNDVSQICFAFNWSRGHCELSYYQWLNRNTSYPAIILERRFEKRYAIQRII